MDNQSSQALANDKEVILNNSDAMTATKNLNNLQLPYIIKDKILMSPGTWKGYIYNNQTIIDAFNNTKWNFNNRSLFWEHDDKDGRAWVGEIRNIRLNNSAETVGDIYVVDRQLATNLDFGAKFGISPRLLGTARGDKVVWNAKFDNFSIVINPACTTTFLNSEIKEEIEEVKNIGDVKTMTDGVEQSSASTEINKLSSLMETLVKEIGDVKSKTNTLYSDREKIVKEEELKGLEEKRKIAIVEKEVRDKRDIEMMDTLKAINSKLGKAETETPATENVVDEKKDDAAEEVAPAEASEATDDSEKKVDEKMSEDAEKTDESEDEMTKEDSDPVSESGKQAAEDLNIMLSVEKNKTFNNGYTDSDVEMAKYLKNAFKV